MRVEFAPAFRAQKSDPTCSPGGSVDGPKLTETHPDTKVPGATPLQHRKKYSWVFLTRRDAGTHRQIRGGRQIIDASAAQIFTGGFMWQVR